MERGGALPSLAGIDHIGYNVPDMQQAIDFFTVALGCKLLDRDPPHPFGEEAGVSVETAVLRLTTGEMVELLTFSVPGQPPAPLSMTGAAGYHLALAITDLDAAQARLRAIPGVAVREAAPLHGVRRRAFATTPWGMPLQLIEPRERR